MSKQHTRGLLQAVSSGVKLTRTHCRASARGRGATRASGTRRSCRTSAWGAGACRARMLEARAHGSSAPATASAHTQQGRAQSAPTAAAVVTTPTLPGGGRSPRSWHVSLGSGGAAGSHARRPWGGEREQGVNTCMCVGVHGGRWYVPRPHEPLHSKSAHNTQTPTCHRPTRGASTRQGATRTCSAHTHVHGLCL